MDFAIQEKEFYNFLVDETNSTDKQNAFLGYLPDITNVWGLICNGTLRNQLYPCTKHLALNYEIKGRFAERDTALLFLSMIIETMKDLDLSNLNEVERLFLEKVYQPKERYIVLYGSKSKTMHWELRLPFTVQFSEIVNTGIPNMGIGINFGVR